MGAIAMCLPATTRRWLVPNGEAFDTIYNVIVAPAVTLPAVICGAVAAVGLAVKCGFHLWLPVTTLIGHLKPRFIPGQRGEGMVKAAPHPSLVPRRESSLPGRG